MDFEKVLNLIIKEFEIKKIRYALIGGFALGAFGVMRATMDIDFLIHSDDLIELKKILKNYSYKIIYETENVMQFSSDIEIMGELDFIIARRELSQKMLENTAVYEIFDALKIKILKPEELIAFKLQAIKNDQSRESKDFFDIESILKINNNIDWQKLEYYFSLFDFLEKYTNFKNQYQEIKNGDGSQLGNRSRELKN